MALNPGSFQKATVGSEQIYQSASPAVGRGAWGVGRGAESGRLKAEARGCAEAGP